MVVLEAEESPALSASLPFEDRNLYKLNEVPCHVVVVCCKWSGEKYE